MLSGVGPAAQLLHHNIRVVLDVPSVGANLMDHQTCSVRLEETTRMTFDSIKPNSLRGTYLFARDLLRYQLWGTGLISSNVGQDSYIHIGLC